jgi:hypothetical protein
VKSRKPAGPQKKRSEGMRPESFRELAFVGGSGAFQPEIACHSRCIATKAFGDFGFKSIRSKIATYLLAWLRNLLEMLENAVLSYANSAHELTREDPL